MNANHPNNRIPEEIRLQHGHGALTLVYGAERKSPNIELLRVFSPSTEVRGHAPGQEVLQTNKAGIIIMGLESARQYALRITFSDGHNSGLHDWAYLHKLTYDYDALRADYLHRMELTDASRIPSPDDLEAGSKSGHTCSSGGCGGRH